MKRLILLLALIIIPVSAFAADAGNNKNKTNIYSVDSSEFDGFEYCKVSSKLAETIKGLMSAGSPEQKGETAWTFAIDAEVYELPVHRMLIGVCDISGERGCGWGNYLAIVIAKPLEEVNKRLEKKFGADFTEEKREKEFEVTLRPVLARGKKSGESILFCDPGNL